MSLVVVTGIFIYQSLNPTPEILTTAMFFQAVKPLNLLAFLLALILMVFYTFNVAKAPIHTNKERTWYILGIWMLPFIVMPTYYLQYIWKAKAEDKSISTTLL